MLHDVTVGNMFPSILKLCATLTSPMFKTQSLSTNIISVALTSFTVPLFDEICRRVMNFIYSCLNCNSQFIRAIVLHGINVSRINSPMGRNAVFCSLRYNICVDHLYDTKLSSNYCFARFKSELPTDLLARANVLREAILIRDGIFALPNTNRLRNEELNYLIESLAIGLN